MCVVARDGGLTETIHRRAALEIRRSQMKTACICDGLEFGEFSAGEFVSSENSLFWTPDLSAKTMSGGSMIFAHERPFPIANGAGSRSVILRIPINTFTNETGAKSGLRRCQSVALARLKHALSTLTAAKEATV